MRNLSEPSFAAHSSPWYLFYPVITAPTWTAGTLSLARADTQATVPALQYLHLASTPHHTKATYIFKIDIIISKSPFITVQYTSTSTLVIYKVSLINGNPIIFEKSSARDASLEPVSESSL